MRVTSVVSAAAALILVGSVPVRTRARPALDLIPSGQNLTVTTAHSVATFLKADLVGLTNTLTGDSYLTHPSGGELADVNTIAQTGQALSASNWTVAFDAALGTNVATIVLSDSVRTLTVSVWVDPSTDEIAVRSSAAITAPGLRGASWSIAGLDLNAGRIVLPARSGQVIDKAHPGTGADYSYPLFWNAQMAVYERGAGSLLLYSTDQSFWFKRLRFSTRGNTTVDVAVGTDAAGPFGSASTVPPIEWRLKAFQGDWQAPAMAYRTWLNTTRPPVADAFYPWVSTVRTVLTVHGLDTGLLASMAARFVPSQTMLYLVDWRAAGFDVNYPDYTPAPAAVSYVSAAKALGFRIMLHTDLIGVSPGSADYPSMAPFQLRDPESLQLMGWQWEMPPATPTRFAIINPASNAFRSLFVSRVGVAVSALQPDALHVDISGPMYNDGNGLINGRTYPQGSAQLHQDLRAAFPNVALASEGENDIIARYHAFAQVLTFVNTYGGEKPAPGHPIVAFLFAPSVQFYGHLSFWYPRESGFKSMFEDTIRRGSMPALQVGTAADLNTADPDVARAIGLLQTWQTHGYRLATGDWQGDLVRWNGSDATVATLTDPSNLLTLTAAGSPVVQLAHHVNQLATSRYNLDWPAFAAAALFGLDAANLYFLDAVPRPDSTHITALPAGIRVGSSTLVAPGFTQVEVLPPATTAFQAEANLLQAHVGAAHLGVDVPMSGAAQVRLGTIVAGGEARPGLFIHPPPQGETYAEFQVAVPAVAALQFGVAVDDNAACTDGVTFRVTVNGTTLYAQHYGRGAWHDEVVSLSAYGGTTVALRIVSNAGPANVSNCDWSLWNNVRVETFSGSDAITVPITLASGQTLTGFSGAGLLTPITPSSVQVSNVPVPGLFTIFTGTGSAVGAGTSLASVPFQAWFQTHDELAKPGSYFGFNPIGAGSAGGVFKSPTLNGTTPPDGLIRMTWTLQLPAGIPLRLTWSAGLVDGATTVDGVEFEVRVNGVAYWSLVSSAHAWIPGSLDLSAWQGQTILLELVTDSRASNYGDWSHWADVTLSSAGSACGYSLPSGTSIGAAGGATSLAVTAGAGCPWLAMSSASWLVLGSPSAGSGGATVPFTVAPNVGGTRTATISAAGRTFTVVQAAGSSELIQDQSFAGGFNQGATGWRMFALPDLSYLPWSVTNGVVSFSRLAPPAGQPGQATIFQNTQTAVPAGGGLEASFNLGNTSTARKRISVLVLDHDFSDLSVCTFWLAPGAPLRTYRMRTHTTKPWTNASIYFYAATPGLDGGAYQLANVSLHQDAAVSPTRTDCVDPVVTPPVAVADGSELLTNGAFGTGTTAGWTLFGQLVSQVANGVFEFYRPAATPNPAGVIFQTSTTAIPAGRAVTARFDLGNTTPVRKRVSVLLHDLSFGDLHVCTFWLAPGQPRSTYEMRSYSTMAWPAPTISIYAASPGDHTWTQLDNVSFRATPSQAVTGTECREPGD